MLVNICPKVNVQYYIPSQEIKDMLLLLIDDSEIIHIYVKYKRRNQTAASCCGTYHCKKDEITLEGNVMKRKRILIYCMVLVFVLASGCDALNRKVNTSYKIWSVNQAQSGSVFVCGNSQHTYVYQSVNDMCGIYEYDTQKRVVPFDDGRLFCCMAATDQYLLYHTKKAEGTLCVYSLEQEKQLQQIEKMNICGMKADENNIFIVREDENKKQYEVGVFCDNELIWLNDVLKDKTYDRQEGEYYYYSYGEYEIVVRKQEQKQNVVFVERDEFLFNCSPTDVYVKTKQGLFHMDQKPEFLPQYAGMYGGVSGKMVSVVDGECYFIAQYSKKEYRENPSVDFAEKSLFCKYDIEHEIFEVLYEAKKGEQVVSFLNHMEDVMLVTKEGLVQMNLQSKKKTMILKDQFAADLELGTYYFECYGDEMLIFSKNSLQQENGPQIEKVVKIN